MAKRKAVKAEGWAVSGDFGDSPYLFTGWWHTRKEAIADHTKAVGWDWATCRRKGHRAIRVTITPTRRTRK